MANIKRYNNQDGATTSSLASGGTTLTDTVKLPSLPAVTGTDIVKVILNPDKKQTGAPEVVYITAHTASATTATILRAQEGTTSPASWPSGTTWEHGPTAQDFGADIVDGTTIVSAGGRVSVNLLGVDGAHMAVGAVDTPQLANNAVNTAEIADAAVTAAKFAPGAVASTSDQVQSPPGQIDTTSGTAAAIITFTNTLTLPAWTTKQRLRVSLVGAASVAPTSTTEVFLQISDGTTTLNGTSRFIAAGDAQPIAFSFADSFGHAGAGAGPWTVKLMGRRAGGAGFMRSTTSTVVDLTATIS